MGAAFVKNDKNLQFFSISSFLFARIWYNNGETHLNSQQIVLFTLLRKIKQTVSNVAVNHIQDRRACRNISLPGYGFFIGKMCSGLFVTSLVLRKQQISRFYGHPVCTFHTVTPVSWHSDICWPEEPALSWNVQFRRHFEF